MVSSNGNAWLLLAVLKAHGWSEHFFAGTASPRASTKKKMAVSPACAVHDGQYETKYVAFEKILLAEVVADKNRVGYLEPAHKYKWTFENE